MGGGRGVVVAEARGASAYDRIINKLTKLTVWPLKEKKKEKLADDTCFAMCSLTKVAPMFTVSQTNCFTNITSNPSLAYGETTS